MARKSKWWFLDFCSYYRAEDVDPFQLKLAKNVGCLSEVEEEALVLKSTFWHIERIWCNKVANWEMPLSHSDEYIERGFKDFKTDDGVPMTLKAMLYHRMDENSKDNPQAFEEYYTNCYIGLRAPKKRMTVGKRILNQYRLEMCYFYSDKDKEKKESEEQHYMFEIVNAVDVHLGLDKPVSETLMCRFLAHAHAHNYKVDVIPNPGQNKSDSVKTYHLEFREIRQVLFSHLKLKSDNYDAVVYVGRWNNKYVYTECSDILEQNFQFPVFYLIKEGEVERVQNYRCIEIMKDVRL